MTLDNTNNEMFTSNEGIFLKTILKFLKTELGIGSYAREKPVYFRGPDKVHWKSNFFKEML